MKMTPEALAKFFEAVLPYLNERRCRVVVGSMAGVLSRSG